MDSELLDLLSHGKDRMPAFDGAMPAADRQAVVAFVRMLQQKSARPLLAVLCIPILVARRSSWVSARAIAYWAVWLADGEALRPLSRRQDVDADREISR